MALLDLAILVGFVTYAIASGFRSSAAASTDLESYFLAGRSLPGWMAGASMAATQFAADTPLLVTGLVATAGLFSLWRLWVYALSFLLMGFVLSGPWRRSGVLTDAEFTELRYSGTAAAWLRGIKAIYFGTIFNCTVLAMVLLATTVLTEVFLPWHLWLPERLHDIIRALVATIGVPLTATDDPTWVKSADNAISLGCIVLVTTLYSTTGGLRSVVRTDVAQLAIMLTATAGYAAWVLAQVGGREGLLDGLHAMFARHEGPTWLDETSLLALTPDRAHGVTGALLGVFAVQWLVQINADGTGYLAQRSMACRSDADARQAALVFTGVQIILRSVLWIPIALGLLLLFPVETSASPEAMRLARERTFILGIEQLPPGLRGLMLTGMLAALASTVDTHLNWGSSYWTNDIYKRFVCPTLQRRPSERELVLVARLANLLILAIALGIMTQLSSIQSAWRLSLLLGSGVGVVLVLRWVWWRMTARGELSCIGAALLLAPLLLSFVDGDAVRLLSMAGACTSVAILVSVASGPEPTPTLERFYARVHPPGFWRAIGGDGAAERALARGLGATVSGGLGVFSLLLLLGSLLFDVPPPAGLEGAWLALLAVLSGLGLTGAWALGTRDAGE